MFYGEYRSSTVSQNGCVKKFVTAPRQDLLFDAQVVYECDMCKSRHNFGFVRSWSIATPKQEKRFAEYCTANHIDMQH